MKFSRSVVLSTLLMFALAVAFSGVAQAQDCAVRAPSSMMVRAEGLTEVVGNIELRCGRPAPDTSPGIGFEDQPIPNKFTVALELNSHITNEISDSRVVSMAGDMAVDGYNAYIDPGIRMTAYQLNNAGQLTFDSDGEITSTELTSSAAAPTFGSGELSDDGSMISWTFYTANDDDTADVEEGNINLDPNQDSQGGFHLVISMIRVNASMVGDGEDVMANVLVGGNTLNANPLKVADVSTGLAASTKVAEGVQCSDSEVMGRVTLAEGYASAFMDMDSFMVTFTGVPEGVTVTVPNMVELAANDPATSANETVESFRLRRHTGRTSGADADGVVDLSAAGAGSVRYMIAMTDAIEADNTVTPNIEAAAAMSTLMSGGNEEWQHIYVTFAWDGGDADLGSVMVYVNFYPASDEGGDTFAVGGADVPRFVDDDASDTLLSIGDCKSSLFFPFVTSQSGYDTGIVVSNTSGAAGSCMATYSGPGAPEDAVGIGEIMPGMQAIFLVGGAGVGPAHGLADFSGYLTVDCELESSSGFAHIADGSGLAGSQGYIAQ